MPDHRPNGGPIPGSDMHEGSNNGGAGSIVGLSERMKSIILSKPDTSSNTPVQPLALINNKFDRSKVLRTQQQQTKGGTTQSLPASPSISIPSPSPSPPPPPAAALSQSELQDAEIRRKREEILELTRKMDELKRQRA